MAKYGRNKKKVIKIVSLVIFVVGLNTLISAQKYSDGRPEATLRMDARDHGIVLRYGDGPKQCDILGARDVDRKSVV